MKRFTAIVLVLAMLVSTLALTGCGSKGAAEAEPTTIGTKLFATFKTAVADNKDASCEDLAAAVLESELIEFAGATMPVESGWLNGFANDITGFAEGSMFGPMIGSIPFIGYVFRLDKGADVDAFMQTLSDQADLRWNICTSADEMVVDHVENLVFFVMCPESFEE